MSDRERIAAGERAARELEQTASAFEAVERDLINSWVVADMVDAREALHAQVIGLRAVRQKLNAAVAAGTMAAAR